MGIVATLFWALLANALVATQVVEGLPQLLFIVLFERRISPPSLIDGTRSSLVVRRYDSQCRMTSPLTVPFVSPFG
jgi:hypothetical protein